MGDPIDLLPRVKPIQMPKACQICLRKDHLLLCSGCKAVYYCGVEHQNEGRGSHKHYCVAIKKARTTLEQEEQRLRSGELSWWSGADTFQDSRGHFWGIVETRDYMEARYRLVDLLLRYFDNPYVGRDYIVEIAYDHLWDMVHLNRSDNMGLQHQIPALLIRLGREQEAYDFMKWHQVVYDNHQLRYLDDIEMPIYNIKGADVLASAAPWYNVRSRLSHCAAIMLIKIRALLALRDSQNVDRFFRHTCLPQEIIDHIRSLVLENSVIKSHPIMVQADNMEEITRVAERLMCQIQILFRRIAGHNRYFWPTMIHKAYVVYEEIVESYPPGTFKEACLMVRYNHAAWIQTAGAIELVEDLLAKVTPAVEKKTPLELLWQGKKTAC